MNRALEVKIKVVYDDDGGLTREQLIAAVDDNINRSVRNGLLNTNTNSTVKDWDVAIEELPR